MYPVTDHHRSLWALFLYSFWWQMVVLFAQGIKTHRECLNNPAFHNKQLCNGKLINVVNAFDETACNDAGPTCQVTATPRCEYFVGNSKYGEIQAGCSTQKTCGDRVKAWRQSWPRCAGCGRQMAATELMRLDVKCEEVLAKIDICNPATKTYDISNGLYLRKSWSDNGQDQYCECSVNTVNGGLYGVRTVQAFLTLDKSCLQITGSQGTKQCQQEPQCDGKNSTWKTLSNLNKLHIQSRRKSNSQGVLWLEIKGNANVKIQCSSTTTGFTPGQSTGCVQPPIGSTTTKTTTMSSTTTKTTAMSSTTRKATTVGHIPGGVTSQDHNTGESTATGTTSIDSSTKRTTETETNEKTKTGNVSQTAGEALGIPIIIGAAGVVLVVLVLIFVLAILCIRKKLVPKADSENTADGEAQKQNIELGNINQTYIPHVHTTPPEDPDDIEDPYDIIPHDDYLDVLPDDPVTGMAPEPPPARGPHLALLGKSQSSKTGSLHEVSSIRSATLTHVEDPHSKTPGDNESFNGDYLDVVEDIDSTSINTAPEIPPRELLDDDESVTLDYDEIDDDESVKLDYDDTALEDTSVVNPTRIPDQESLDDDESVKLDYDDTALEDTAVVNPTRIPDQEPLDDDESVKLDYDDTALEDTSAVNPPKIPDQEPLDDDDESVKLDYDDTALDCPSAVNQPKIPDQQQAGDLGK